MYEVARLLVDHAQGRAAELGDMIEAAPGRAPGGGPVEMRDAIRIGAPGAQGFRYALGDPVDVWQLANHTTRPPPQPMMA